MDAVSLMIVVRYSPLACTYLPLPPVIGNTSAWVAPVAGWKRPWDCNIQQLISVAIVS